MFAAAFLKFEVEIMLAKCKIICQMPYRLIWQHSKELYLLSFLACVQPTPHQSLPSRRSSLLPADGEGEGEGEGEGG